MVGGIIRQSFLYTMIVSFVLDEAILFESTKDITSLFGIKLTGQINFLFLKFIDPNICLQDFKLLLSFS